MKDPRNIIIALLSVAVLVLGYLYYDSQRNMVRIQFPGVKIDAR